MTNGGLLALLTRFGYGVDVFNEGGGLRFQLHVYPSKQYKQSINKLQCSSTWLCCQMMWIVLMWSRFHLQQVNWSWFESEFKFKLQMSSNWFKLHLLKFVHFEISSNVYDMPLKCGWFVVSSSGSKCKSIWKDLNLNSI